MKYRQDIKQNHKTHTHVRALGLRSRTSLKRWAFWTLLSWNLTPSNIVCATYFNESSLKSYVALDAIDLNDLLNPAPISQAEMSNLEGLNNSVSVCAPMEPGVTLGASSALWRRHFAQLREMPLVGSMWGWYFPLGLVMGSWESSCFYLFALGTDWRCSSNLCQDRAPAF